VVVRDSTTLHRLDNVTQPVANIDGTVLPATLDFSRAAAVRDANDRGSAVTVPIRVLAISRRNSAGQSYTLYQHHLR
jgi:hypothetical protein